METLPLVPDPITAVILVGETTLNDVAAIPPKLTAVAPVKLDPVIVTIDPIFAVEGAIEVMVGIWLPTVTKVGMAASFIEFKVMLTE